MVEIIVEIVIGNVGGAELRMEQFRWLIPKQWGGKCVRIVALFRQLLQSNPENLIKID